jgi:hypothetical protein
VVVGRWLTDNRVARPKAPSTVRSLDDAVNVLLVDDDSAKLLSYEAILDLLGENLIKAGSAMCLTLPSPEGS